MYDEHGTRSMRPSSASPRDHHPTRRRPRSAATRGPKHRSVHYTIATTATRSRTRRRRNGVVLWMVLFTVTCTCFHVSWCAQDDNNDKREANHHSGGGGSTESSSGFSWGVTSSRPESSSATATTSTTSHSSVLEDAVDDSLYDPIQSDPDCIGSSNTDADALSCWAPPDSTMDEQEVLVPSVKTISVIDATCSYGGINPGDDVKNVQQQEETTCRPTETDAQQVTTASTTTIRTDKHWGSDPTILNMRDKLRESGSGKSSSSSAAAANNSSNSNSTDKQGRRRGGSRRRKTNRRPPIFLMPGLASTRLIAWRFKSCPQHPFLSDIKVQENVWLNINLLVQMGTIDDACLQECLRLGLNQSDTDDLEKGCKLRPDEGLDAISSLSPGGIGSSLLVGGTNTVYSWLIQWLADNLGYDVTSIVGLPYDWRLSPDKMEERDGFLTLTRRRIEAAVQTNGEPGIMVAHSMGNIVFRYFLVWLRTELREEAYRRHVKQFERRAAKAIQQQQHHQQQAASNTKSTAKTPMATRAATLATIMAQQQQQPQSDDASGLSQYLPGWMTSAFPSLEDWWTWATTSESDHVRPVKLWELARHEGDAEWIEWIEKHIWTYVGLSAPILGAINPLRAVLSGENMGLPWTDDVARDIEISFGSTHTVNPMSSKRAFCDNWEFNEWDEEEPAKTTPEMLDSRLACLDDIVPEVEANSASEMRDPWENFPALRLLLKERKDWDSDFPMVNVVKEKCSEKEKSPCARNTTINLGPRDVETGRMFTEMSNIWREPGNPMGVKREQLRESFWDTKVPNILNNTWERPPIKHVIMAYGVDIPTEVGYTYVKTEREGKESRPDGIPNLKVVLWEKAGGFLEKEKLSAPRGGLKDILKIKPQNSPVGKGSLPHSGDGSVPYLSLAYAQTWLLHATRAILFSGKESAFSPLSRIEISHRPKGATEWEQGPRPKLTTILGEKKVEESSDTGTDHPHGTRYKPEMVKYRSHGTSRTTDSNYTTTMIEAIGVEHKETTRNYDILAAVFTDVLRNMHDDFEIV